MSQSHKFCVNCRHYIETAEECRHPKAAYIYMQDMAKFLVSGSQDDMPIRVHKCCTTMRSYDHLCGEQGRYWTVAIAREQAVLLPPPDPPPVKHLETTWGRVWPWIQSPLALAALWLMWWVAVQLAD